MIASGPYATDVRASSDRAESPSTGVICSLEASLDRSGRPISRFQAERPPGRLAGCSATRAWYGTVRAQDRHRASRPAERHRLQPPDVERGQTDAGDSRASISPMASAMPSSIPMFSIVSICSTLTKWVTAVIRVPASTGSNVT